MASSSEMARGQKLNGIQERFLTGLREGEEGLAAAGSALVEEPPTGTAAERLHIYSEGYVIRLIDAIENDTPALARVLGESSFQSLCDRYLRANPPSSPDIGRASDRLPEYLATDGLLEKLPFLADLARFELMLARAVVAANPKPVSWAELVGGGVEALLDLKIHLLPGAGVIRSAWPISEIWALKDLPDDQVSLDLVDRPSTLVLFRRGFEVTWREVKENEALFLKSLTEKPASLAELADSGLFGEPQSAAPLLVSLFRSAVESSIVGAGSDGARERSQSRRD